MRHAFAALVFAFAPSALALPCPEAVVSCLSPKTEKTELLRIDTPSKTLVAAVGSDKTGTTSSLDTFRKCTKELEGALGPHATWTKSAISPNRNSFRGCEVKEAAAAPPKTVVKSKCPEAVAKCFSSKDPVKTLLTIETPTHRLYRAVGGDPLVVGPNAFLACNKAFVDLLGPEENWLSSTWGAKPEDFVEGCVVETR